MLEPMPRQLQEGGGNTLRVAGALFIISFVLAVLYLGRMVLEPLAIAVLLAFVLTPLIRRLRAWHFGRVVSVIAVVGLALGIIGAFVFIMETEITHFAREIPNYQQNLREKIASLNRAFASSGTLKRATSTLNSLASDLKDQRGGTASGAPAGEGTPVPVQVQTQPCMGTLLSRSMSSRCSPYSNVSMTRGEPAVGRDMRATTLYSVKSARN